MRVSKFVAVIICLLTLGAVFLYAQDPAPSDIEQRHAFLVKLKSGKTSRSAANDDWQMTPLASEVQTRGEAAPSGNWWLLSQRSRSGRAGAESATGAEDWDRAYDLYSGNAPSGSRGVSGNTRAPLTARSIQAGDVEFIEPDLGFFAPSTKISPVPPQTTTSSPSKTVIGTAQTRHWPQFSDFAAYQKDEFSQLGSAREMVEAKLAETHEEPVRVAFLDTGYDSKHLARPRNVNKALARNFIEDKTNPDGVSLDQQPGLAGSQSHGTGTIGILAGDVIKLDGIGDKPGFSGPLGGAPFAEIAPMRVATSVVHLENPFIKTRPSGTTRAILYAIRNKCDVISMSHGGLPSRALAEAINAGYEAGIAMFFASGDYLQPENLGVLHSPRYVVYPAAFSRAMCVCGVTADYKTYGKPPSDHYDPSLGPPESWQLRGNWGPAAWMKNAIAAFSPNIPWAHQPKPDSREGENVIDLDGQGTSASTPQAAAAAVLWLQYYRSDSDLKSIWGSWKKPELVYMALRRSARQVQDPATPDYSQTFFGGGVLQAKEALAIAPGGLYPVKENEASVGLGWMRLFASVIGGTRAEGVSEDTLKQMFGLELAQIAQRSPQVQDIMQRYGGYDPDAEDKPSTGELADFKKELFNAIKDDNRVSQHLRDAIRKELGTP